MANSYPFSKGVGSFAHLPTYFFIIGYPIFWLELYVWKAPAGVTSPLGWIMFSCLAAVALICSLKNLRNFGKELVLFWSSLGKIQKFIWFAGFSLSFFVLMIVLRAGTLPIHLGQETDCMNYHYTLPRQHLILASFKHIPWAADDLFLLPIDFSLSPFWFVTVLPNKLPQLLIMLGLISILARIVYSSTGRIWAGFLVVLAFLGSHGVGIQMGTGMLDLAVAYLFFASWDSFRKGLWVLGVIEFTFFFWSKPLMPVQIICAGMLLALVVFAAKSFRWEINFEWGRNNWHRSVWLFVFLSLFIGGPFVVKSIVYAATPLFPLEPGMLGNWGKIQVNPLAWESLQKASHLWINGIKDSYGHGRGVLEFLQHLWLIAVPEKGVNNSFDYPLGLAYLLFLGPFLVYWVKDLCKKKLDLSYVLVFILWGLWWMSSQQSRFLYVPLLLIFVLTSIRFARLYSMLVVCLVMALTLQVVSLRGAHKDDFFRLPMKVLRDSDLQLVEMSQKYIRNHDTEVLLWKNHEVAFAQFPVKVDHENLPHTIFSNY